MLITYTEILVCLFFQCGRFILCYIISSLECKVQIIKCKLKTVSHHRSLHRMEQVPMSSVTEIITYLVQQQLMTDIQVFDSSLCNFSILGQRWPKNLKRDCYFDLHNLLCWIKYLWITWSLLYIFTLKSIFTVVPGLTLCWPQFQWHTFI